MFKSYFLIAFRNLWKNRMFSGVNIIGLAFGMATCLLIFQYVSFEFGFDRFHKNYKNTYRIINTRLQNGEQIQEGPITYPTIGPAMAAEFSEIEAYTRMMPGGRVYLKRDQEVFTVDNAHFADKYFMSVLDYPMVSGDRSSSLTEPNALMLSTHMAKKIFGDDFENFDKLLGTSLIMNNQNDPFKITGFFERPPENSHMDFDMLVSFKTLINGTQGAADSSWNWSDFRHYLVLNPHAVPEKLETKFKAFSDKYFQGEQVSGSEERFFLQPLEKVHFDPSFEYDVAKTTNGKIIWTLAFVASFILILAWINYINLTTSKALERAKEVGIRKVMGAIRTQLISQFLAESIVVNCLALFFAFTIVQILQPYFNQLVEIELSLFGLFADNADQLLLSITFLIFFIVGIFFSAFYPAFVLSGYKPAVVLKGKFHRSAKGILLKKLLVVFQFAASVTLITGSIVVFRQIDFIENKQKGISIDNTLVIYGPQLTNFDSTFINTTNSFKQTLKELAIVEAASTSSRIPGQRLGRNFNLRRKTGGSRQKSTVSINYVDYDFLSQFNVQVLAGRGFLFKDHNPDFNALDKVVVNKSVVELLGFANVSEAVNQKILFGDKDWTIIGVVNDFHQESVHRPLEAMVFFPSYYSGNFISVKLNETFDQQGIGKIESIYEEFFPGNSFDYFFLDESYNRQYSGEFQFSSALQFFTFLAILIACFGLFGLSTHTISQRTKEIGIRKVMGASIQNIVFFLARYYMQLIGIAGILALPLAYIGSNKWLNNYVYKTEIPWWVYVIPLGIILSIAFLTICIQTIKAANRNPIKSLRQD